MNEKAIFIEGGISVDDRGELLFCNDFDMDGIRRFYQVSNHSSNFIRAWHAHKNESKYVFLPSKAEGIGLPMIEAMICGSIPITCSDNLTAKEFSPIEFISEPDPASIKKKIEELNEKYIHFRKIALGYGEKYKNQFNKKNIAKNIIDIFNKYK